MQPGFGWLQKPTTTASDPRSGSRPSNPLPSQASWSSHITSAQSAALAAHLQSKDPPLESAVHALIGGVAALCSWSRMDEEMRDGRRQNVTHDGKTVRRVNPSSWDQVVSRRQARRAAESGSSEDKPSARDRGQVVDHRDNNSTRWLLGAHLVFPCKHGLAWLLIFWLAGISVQPSPR
jgi:hypothetical protein